MTLNQMSNCCAVSKYRKSSDFPHVLKTCIYSSSTASKIILGFQYIHVDIWDIQIPWKFRLQKCMLTCMQMFLAFRISFKLWLQKASQLEIIHGLCKLNWNVFSLHCSSYFYAVLCTLNLF